MITAPIVCRSFIGRELEREFLQERFQDARNGHGSIVVVAGEPGIGKSRLVAQFRSSLPPDATCFAGQCFVFARSPLGPVIALLQQVMAAGGPSADARSPENHAVTRLLGSEARAPGGASEADDRQAQYAGIFDALRRFAQRRSSVLVLEDVQWADLGTLEFLQHAAPRIASVPLLLVLTLRDDEPQQEPATATALARLAAAPSVWRLDLEPLAGHEIEELLQDALPASTSRDERLLLQIRQLSEGNPLFAEELLRQSFGPGKGDLPRSLAAAIDERMTLLDEKAHAILRHAAVLGRRFRADFLASLTSTSLEVVLDVLRRARELQLVTEERDDPGRFAFRHALIREALYSKLLVTEAARLHRDVVDVLSGRPDAAKRTTELAYHAWAARDAARAGPYNEAAGDEAMCVLAHSDAVTFFERAREFAERESLPRARLDDKLALALSQAGYAPRSRAAANEALRYFERTGDRIKVAELALRVGALYTNEPKEGSWEHWPLRALEILADEQAHPLYHAALVRLARGYIMRGDITNASRYLAEAQKHAGSAEADSLVEFHDARGALYAADGRTAQAYADLEAARRTAEDAGDVHGTIRSLTNFAEIAGTFRDFPQAVAAASRAAEISHRHYLARREYAALVTLTEIFIAAERYDEARGALAGAIGAEGSGWSVGAIRQTAALSLGLRVHDDELIARNNREDVIETLFQSDEVTLIYPAAAVWARWYARQGRREEAGALLRRALDYPGRSYNLSVLALAVAEFGGDEDVERGRSLLLPWASSALNTAGAYYLAEFDRLIAQRDRATETKSESGKARRARLPHALTSRESDVARLVAEGKSNRAIASELCISERTVEAHVASAYTKLGVNSRVDLTRLVLERRAGDRLQAETP